MDSSRIVGPLTWPLINCSLFSNAISSIYVESNQFICSPWKECLFSVFQQSCLNSSIFIWLACPLHDVSTLWCFQVPVVVTLHSAESGLAVILCLSQGLDTLPVMITITIITTLSTHEALPVSGGQHRVPGHNRVISHQRARLRSGKNKQKGSDWET